MTALTDGEIKTYMIVYGCIGALAIWVYYTYGSTGVGIMLATLFATRIMDAGRY